MNATQKTSPCVATAASSDLPALALAKRQRDRE